MSAHARLGPSNHRWPHCPGSVREEAAYPDVAGAAAIDGTGSHLLLEICLTGPMVPAADYIGQIIGANHPDNPMGWLVNPDRAERVQMCLDYIDRRMDELQNLYPTCIVAVEAESKANPGGMFGRDDWWGTTDITISVTDKDSRLNSRIEDRLLYLEVIDYKDGREFVDAKDNSQLISYAGGKLRPYIASGPELVRPFNTYGIQPVRMTIVQPKTTPVVRYHDMPVDILVTRLEELAWAAAATDKQDAPLIAGKWCRWCKHKNNCTAKNESGLSVAGGVMSNIIVSDNQSIVEVLQNAVMNLGELSEEQLSQLADAREGIANIFDKVDKEIESRIDRGITVPGYAKEPGRGTNKWNQPEAKIAEALKKYKLKKDDIYETKLISPAGVAKLSQLTKDQKDQITKDLISYVAGDLKLKKVSREIQKPSIEEMFKDVVAQSNTPVLQSPPSDDISFM
jgi:hypothetical protein